jgi:hypothetical protein
MTVSGIARRWTRFWFEPASPVDLGVSRVLFYSGLLLVYLSTDFSEWGGVSPAFWMPIPIFEVLGLKPLPAAGLGVVELLWRISLVTSAVGLRTRLSMWVAFLFGFYLLGLPHNFGHTFHFDATLVIALGVLAVSRAGDAWSLDAAFARQPKPPSGEYTWPIRAVWTAIALVFLAAGIAKLRYGGLDWVFSANLSVILNRAAYHVSDADPITTLGLWIAEHRWLSQSMAAATVVIELGFVATLFSKKARIVVVPAACLLLISIRLLMGPTFGGFLIANVFWVPWSAALEAVVARARLGARAPHMATAHDVSATTGATDASSTV